MLIEKNNMLIVTKDGNNCINLPVFFLNNSVSGFCQARIKKLDH